MAAFLCEEYKMKVKPIPKNKRVVDKKGMNKVKAVDHCELCDRMPNGFLNLEVAHVISKGAGGPDIKENCLKLCGPASLQAGCHGANHMGKIDKDTLFAAIAKREGKLVEEIKEIAHRAWRFGEYV